MNMDAFSRRHPIVNFIFFLGAIGFGVMNQHPAYLAAGFMCSVSYYLLLNGRKGLEKLWWMALFFILMTAINPLFNIYGKTHLFSVFGRPYTLEGIFYGAAIAGALVIMIAGIALGQEPGFLVLLLFAGPLLDVCNVLMMPIAMNKQSILAMFGAGFTVNISQGISTFLVLFLLGKLDRIKSKYGMEE